MGNWTQEESYSTSLNAAYSRESGVVVSPSGAKFRWQYGQYPYPAELPDEPDNVRWGLKVEVIVGRSWETIPLDVNTGVRVLRAAGILTEEQISHLKERYKHSEGIDVLG